MDITSTQRVKKKEGNLKEIAKMKTYTAEELQKILENHKHWMNQDCNGWKTMRADLIGADLSRADLSGAYLGGANLSGADLSRAHLSRANLSGADLSRAKNMPYIPMTCQDEGQFIGYKKVEAYIIKLEIPADAKRSSATGRKCRCSKAKVLSIEAMDNRTPHNLKTAVNGNYKETTYTVGKIVRPDSFDENRWEECSHGIHFFINRQEAVDYQG